VSTLTSPYRAKKLLLDSTLIAQARNYAREIVDQITPFILSHSTVTVERATLRLLGINGVNPEGVSLANVVVEHLQAEKLLEHGAARILAQACLYFEKDPQVLAERLNVDEVYFAQLPEFPEQEIANKILQLAAPAVEQIRSQKETREHLLNKLGEGAEPYLYVIVATGNIYEDVAQARAAARQGADIMAVIRSTGQSLRD
jgi:beta-lysine 5,6-aminomutase alpha subunit